MQHGNVFKHKGYYYYSNDIDYELGYDPNMINEYELEYRKKSKKSY